MLPFTGGLASPLNATLVFSVAASVLYLFMVTRPASLARTASKVAATALLAVLAHQAGGPLLLVGVLAVSALGDFFLASDGDRSFLLGLGSFLAAHIGYVVLFLPIGRDLDLPLDMAPTSVLIALLVLAALIIGRILVLRADKAMRGPVIAYVLAILAMGITATFNSLPVLAGALLFKLSDTVLGFERFVLARDEATRKITAPLIWVSYYAAQVTLLFGLLAL